MKPNIDARRFPAALLSFLLFVLLAALAVWLLVEQREPPPSLAEAVPLEGERGGTVVEAPRAPGEEAAAAQKPLPVHLTPVTVVAREESPEASFSGRVVSWTSGQGVAGAELTFARLEATYTVMADAMGEFSLAIGEHGTYLLATVTAEGYLPFAPAWGHSPVTFTSAAGQHLKDIVVYLLPAVEYLGRVIAPDGAPVAGARVKLFIRADRQPTLIPLPDQFTTAEQGEFRFHAPDDTLVEARHPGFAPARGRVDRGVQLSHRMTLKLGPRSDSGAGVLAITGKVLDPQGTPLPDARVVARVASAGPFDPGGGFWASVSEGEGRFELTGLESSGYTLTASYPELLPATIENVPAGAREVILRLGSGGGHIVGEVKSRVDGRPVCGFVVMVSQRTGILEEIPLTSQSVFDPAGRYLVRSLQAGDYLVRVLANGFAATEPVRVSVQPPDEARADFLMVAGGRLTGLVIDAQTREPIAGARVAVEGQAGGGALPVPVVASTTTDVAGEYTLGGLAPGLRSVTVMAYRYHGRILSGIAVQDGAVIGPVAVELTGLKEGEEPRLELTGIGAVLTARGEALQITRVLPGGGAAEAGLVPGDAILAVDGIPVVRLGLDGAIQKIRGPEGTAVLLNVRKAGGEEIRLEVFRRQVRG